MSRGFFRFELLQAFHNQYGKTSVVTENVSLQDYEHKMR